MRPAIQGNEQPQKLGLDTPDCVYSAHLRLLAAILKTAVGDWNQLQEIDDPFCDRSHTTVCVDRYFDNGVEELENFFDSAWFERICIELSLDPNAVYHLVELPILGDNETDLDF